MNYNNILVNIEAGVAEITLNRPDKYNALTVELGHEMVDVLGKVATDDAIRAVLITGAGRGFCAGQDLADIDESEESSGADAPFSFRTHLLESFNPMAIAMRRLEKPIICAINGACAGAGLGLALACDIRYASEKAKFLTAFIGIGLVPDTGVSYWLPRLIGPARAAEMLFTNEKVSAERAAEIGLINRAFSHDSFLDEARALAQKLATAPTKGIGITKRALNHSLGVTFEEQIDYETYLQEEAGLTHDYREGVGAFKEKRPPQFKGK